MFFKVQIVIYSQYPFALKNFDTRWRRKYEKKGVVSGGGTQTRLFLLAPINPRENLKWVELTCFCFAFLADEFLPFFFSFFIETDDRWGFFQNNRRAWMHNSSTWTCWIFSLLEVVVFFYENEKSMGRQIFNRFFQK